MHVGSHMIHVGESCDACGGGGEVVGVGSHVMHTGGEW